MVLEGAEGGRGKGEVEALRESFERLNSEGSRRRILVGRGQ